MHNQIEEKITDAYIQKSILKQSLSSELDPPQASNAPNVLARLEHILDRTQDQIKVADQKAGLLLALVVAIVGFTSIKSTQFSIPISLESFTLFNFAYALFLLSSITSILILLLVIVSRFGGTTPQSKVFFAHISSIYKFDFYRYSEDVAQTTVKGWINEYSAQILETSNIATEKHQMFRRGTIATICTLLLSALVTVL